MTEETYTPIYAVKEDILTRVGYLNQTPKEELITSVMKSADNTVNSRLSNNSLPTFENGDEIPDVLKTAACYYAVSDLLQSLYGKDDRSSNEKGFYDKAESLMNDYINQMLIELQDDNALEKLDPYGISQSPDAFDLGLIHR